MFRTELPGIAAAAFIVTLVIAPGRNPLAVDAALALAHCKGLTDRQGGD